MEVESGTEEPHGPRGVEGLTPDGDPSAPHHPTTDPGPLSGAGVSFKLGVWVRFNERLTPRQQGFRTWSSEPMPDYPELVSEDGG